MVAKYALRNRLLELVAEGPMTLAELTVYFPDRASKTIDGALRETYKAGALRIYGWHRNYQRKGRMSAKWGLADDKKDAPQPKAHPSNVYKQRYEHNHKMLIALRKRSKTTGKPPDATWVMMYQLKKAA